MPPESSGGLFSQLASTLPIGGLLGGLGTTSDETNTFLGILKSRTLTENVVKKFDLQERFDAETLAEAVIAFQEDIVDIAVTDEGMITLAIVLDTEFLHPEKSENETRQLCADVAAFMASELDRINAQLQNQQARYNRTFLEKRYLQNKEDIRNLEEELRGFSEKYGMISLSDQLSASVSAAAALESEITLKEVELQVLKNTFNANHSGIRQKQLEVTELRRKLRELTHGNARRDSMAVIPVIADAPGLAMKYLRIQRDLEVQGLIFEFLTQQYEQAKLQEAKDTPTVQILDASNVPEIRTQPKRTILVLAFGFVGAIFAILWASLMEYLERLRQTDPEQHAKFMNSLQQIRKIR